MWLANGIKIYNFYCNQNYNIIQNLKKKNNYAQFAISQEDSLDKGSYENTQHQINK